LAGNLEVRHRCGFGLVDEVVRRPSGVPHVDIDQMDERFDQIVVDLPEPVASEA
jgi:hypothetical protein